MADRDKTVLLSKQISDFCNMLDQVVKDYDWNITEMHRCEDMTQDYLHALEFGGLKYKERARVATQLSLCRQQRRSHKDAAQIIEPIIIYLEGPKGKSTVNELKEVLGKVRKEEKKLKNRVYALKDSESKEKIGSGDFM